VNVISIVLLMVMIMTPLALVMFIKLRVKGKHYCYFLEENGILNPKLCKIDVDMVIDKGVKYIIKQGEDFTRYVPFPSMMPSFFQERVPASLYYRGEVRPVSWAVALRELKKGLRISPIELDAVTDPRWMRAIVHGASEGGGQEAGWRKMVPLLGLAVGAIALLLIFVLFMKMGGVQSGINDIYQQLKVMK
jgi:hypothetical protein